MRAVLRPRLWTCSRPCSQKSICQSTSCLSRARRSAWIPSQSAGSPATTPMTPRMSESTFNQSTCEMLEGEVVPAAGLVEGCHPDLDARVGQRRDADEQRQRGIAVGPVVTDDGAVVCWVELGGSGQNRQPVAPPVAVGVSTGGGCCEGVTPRGDACRPRVVHVVVRDHVRAGRQVDHPRGATLPRDDSGADRGDLDEVEPQSRQPLGEGSSVHGIQHQDAARRQDRAFGSAGAVEQDGQRRVIRCQPGASGELVHHPADARPVRPPCPPAPPGAPWILVANG